MRTNTPRLKILIPALGLLVGFLAGHPQAIADEEHENMKVLEHTGSKLKKSMKDFSKGLGVKCTTCHVKKDFDSEEKAMKDKTRPFFRSTVGETSPEKRAAALADLLRLLELEKPRNEKKLWEGIDAMKKKS